MPDSQKASDTPNDDKPKRLHRATFATDKRHGGYLIRVAGPYPEVFAGREIPVTKKDGTESTEKLLSLIWTGPDAENGGLVALYRFEAKERDQSRDKLPF